MKTPPLTHFVEAMKSSPLNRGDAKPEYWFIDIAEKFLYFLGWLLFARFLTLFAITQSLHITVILAFIASVTAFCTRAVIVWQHKHRLPMAIFLVGEFICLFLAASIQGGIGSSVLFWLPIIPMVCFLMIPAMSIFSVCFSLFVLSLLVVSPNFFGLTASLGLAVTNDWEFFIDIACPILTMAYLAWLYEKKTWSLIDRVEVTKENLHIFKNAIQASSEGIVITNPRVADNPIVYVNKAYEEITGYSFEESVGHNCRFLQPRSDIEGLDILKKSIKKQESVTVVLENKKKSGEIFFNQLTISPVFEKGELSYFVGVQRDLTEERELQSELIKKSKESAHHSKMSALGEMAAGIAHEVNNPLTIISGYALKIKKSLYDDPKNFDFESARGHVEKINMTVTRISKIISSMKRFARDGSNDAMESVSIDTILNDTIELCTQRCKTMDVVLCVDNKLDPDTKIYCREVEVGQVLLNLINNSFDAIRELQSSRGEDSEVDKGWIRITCHEEDECVVVHVSDSGSGVPETLQSKLFEPFFSSKDVGEGTGLGLSISQSIMRQHEGDLWYEADEEDTSFAFKLKKVA